MNIFSKLKFKWQAWRRKVKGEYPATVNEVIDKKLKYKKSTMDILRAFKESKPWRGTVLERTAKLAQLNSALTEAYASSLPYPHPPAIVLVDKAQLAGGGMYVNDRKNKTHIIFLNDENPSVITFLHEFGHAMGKDEWHTCQWSLNLFKRVFPKSFKKLNREGHTLKKEESSPIAFG